MGAWPGLDMQRFFVVAFVLFDMFFICIYIYIHRHMYIHIHIYVYMLTPPPPRMTDRCGEGEGCCPSPCIVCQLMGHNHLSQTQFQSFQISNIPLSLSFQSFQNV